MGLFGRDDQPLDSKPDDSRQKSRPAAPTTAAGNNDRTVISEKIKIDGALSGSGEIVVNGYVYGSIEAQGRVQVAEKGRVEASVHARHAVIAGQVTGNITADDRIELEQTARVDGDITAPRILIHDGATFRGQVNMKKPPSTPGQPSSSARRESPGKTKE